jgi:hypothetical protein
MPAIMVFPLPVGDWMQTDRVPDEIAARAEAIRSDWNG